MGGIIMSVKEFYEIEQSNLFNQAKKITLFTKHPQTIGEFREDLLKEYLKRFTPSQLTIKSGFISDYSNTQDDELFNQQTRQIDFLVYDEHKDIKFFDTDNFAIIKPSMAYAAIEIKSTLSFYKKENKDNTVTEKYPLGGGYRKSFRYEGTLMDAFKNILSISRIAKKYNRTLYTGIFSFDANFDPMKLYQALDFQEIQKQLSIDSLELFPFNICVPEKFFIIIDEQDIFDIAGKANFGEGFYNLLKAHEDEHPSLPLQTFTNTYYNNIRNLLNGSKPENSSIFSVSPGKCYTFSKHFDIN